MPAVNEITADRLRELAAARESYGKVLTLYVNLDPTSFATRPARATEINAVLDEAERTIRQEHRLTHDERQALAADVRAAREQLRADLDFDGAKSLAVFANRGGEQVDILKLPVPVEHHVAIGDGPYLAPLARLGPRQAWWVVLVDRRRARLFTGDASGLREAWSQESDTRGQHDQGGWSQANYQRSREEEAMEHWREVADMIQTRVRAGAPDGILLGGPVDAVSRLEDLLHHEVVRCLAGRVDLDVETASRDAVCAVAAPIIDRHRAQRDRELLERLDAGITPGARGIQDVLEAVHGRRVETLLIGRGLEARGSCCPRCGRLAVTVAGACPLDGAMTEPVGDIVEAAIERTWTQGGDVRVVDDGVPEGIAALLRF